MIKFDTDHSFFDIEFMFGIINHWHVIHTRYIIIHRYLLIPDVEQLGELVTLRGLLLAPEHEQLDEHLHHYGDEDKYLWDYAHEALEGVTDDGWQYFSRVVDGSWRE